MTFLTSTHHSEGNQGLREIRPPPTVNLNSHVPFQLCNQLRHPIPTHPEVKQSSADFIMGQFPRGGGSRGRLFAPYRAGTTVSDCCPEIQPGGAQKIPKIQHCTAGLRDKLLLGLFIFPDELYVHLYFRNTGKYLTGHRSINTNL